MSHKSQRGFTLLELLVTLVIVGILISFVAVSFTTNSYKHEIRAEANQLAQRIELARRVATTHNETWGVSISHTDYRFLKFDPIEDEWIESEDRLFRKHDLPMHMFLEFDGNRDIPRLVDKFNEIDPEMVITPGGEMTPFVLNCKHEHSEQTRILESDGLNKVEVFAITDDREESSDEDDDE
ncbi:MAG: type II secretion system protein GspH [Gammaproteobacteria bacterium]|nr:type II secretion system protein GspH [Gammaproteobacteria bacterium]